MITREVTNWLKKTEQKQYSYDDAMSEFIKISAFLTVEEMKMIKERLNKVYK